MSGGWKGEALLAASDSRRAALVHGAVLERQELLGELSTHLTKPTLRQAAELSTHHLSFPALCNVDLL